MGGSPPPLAFCCLPYVDLLPCPPLQPANVWLVLANVRVAKRVVLGMNSWHLRVFLSKKEVDESANSSRFKR